MNGEILLAADVSQTFAELVLDAHSCRPRADFTLALSGGSTARGCYRELATRAPDEFWTTLELLWGDERCVDADDPDSNYRLAREAIGSRLDQVPEVHPMRCSSDVEDSASQYESLLAGLPGLDLVHLGLGPDGHTASLFPESPALEAPTGRLVVANMDPIGNNPHLRMTFTFEAISRAELVLVTVEGPTKQEALRRIIEGDQSAPASQIDARRIIWIVDRAALGAADDR